MSDMEIQELYAASRRRLALLALGLVLLVTACSSSTSADSATTTTPTSPREAATTPSPSPSEQAEAFPVSAFANIDDDPVSKELATKLQAALSQMSGDGIGMSATVLSAQGIWSGTVGKADGDRDLRVNDQFAIASGTKPVVAAQVMQMVEAGQLDLDDPAADHLPPDLDFDTNAATIRHLLSHRSGIPDHEPNLLDMAPRNLKRQWTAAELLSLVPAGRSPVDQGWDYSNTNYVLLELVIEHLTGRPLSAVLRDGVLRMNGVERLIHQPDEVPSEPMAMPFGRTTVALAKGGGFLPSLAHASGGGGAWGMASDSPSLARWWRAMCSGEIVSQDSLTQMIPVQGDYGLGIFGFPNVGAYAVGHPGVEVGYTSWSACLPEDGTVIVVLANGTADPLFELARPLMVAASDASTGSKP